MVGDDIEVTYLGTNHQQAKLGFTAPRKVSVHREEVYLKIRNKWLSKNAMEGK